MLPQRSWRSAPAAENRVGGAAMASRFDSMGDISIVGIVALVAVIAFSAYLLRRRHRER